MAQAAQIVSLNDYRQARAARRARESAAFEVPTLSASPFVLVWMPVWFVPFAPASVPAQHKA